MQLSAKKSTYISFYNVNLEKEWPNMSQIWAKYFPAADSLNTLSFKQSCAICVTWVHKELNHEALINN